MEQFKKINTGLLDINKKPIFEGSILIRGKKLPLLGHAPKDLKPMTFKPMKVIYHDGSFKITKSKRGRKHYLNSLIIRYYGLTIKE